VDAVTHAEEAVEVVDTVARAETVGVVDTVTHAEGAVGAVDAVARAERPLRVGDRGRVADDAGLEARS